MECSPPDSSVHGDSPDKNSGVSCQALLQGIFLTQGSNPHLLHCRWILLLLSYQGSPPNQLYTRIIVSVNFVQHDNSYLFSSLNFYQNSKVYTISCICLKREIGIKFTYFVYSQSKRKKKNKFIH